MGVWANGFGGWLADELACHNTQPLGSLRVTCPQASSNSTNEKETILPPFVLFGPSPSAPLSPLQTSKLISPSLVAVSSPRLYNFVLPIADLNEEAECDLQGVPCSTYFYLLSSNSNPYPPPSPPAGSIHISKALYDLSHPPSEPHDDPPPPFHSSQSYSQSWGQFTTISQDEVRTALGLKPGPSAAFSQGQTTTSNNFPQASSDSKGGISIAVIAGAGAGVLVIALVALVAWRVVVAKGRRPKVSSLPLSPAGPDISHPSRPPLAPPKHPAPPPRLVKRAKTDWEEGEELRIERAMAAASPAREGSIALREGGIGRASGIGIVSSPILRSNRKAPAPASQPAPLPLTSPTRSRREEADQV